MSSEGECPTCGRVLDEPKPITAKNLDLKRLAAGEDGEADDEGAPWHFKLLIVLGILYFIWRMVDWLVL
jgi:hypothetical protein